MEFKDRLATLIKERKTNISKVAKETQIPRSTLHNYILGTEVPVSKLVILADYFGCSIDYLVRGEKAESERPVVEIIRAEIKSQGLYEISIRKVQEK